MDTELHKLGLKLKFAYSLVGLMLGLGCIIAGVVLGLNGVVGHTNWTASVFGLSTDLNDAAPGVIVFVVGIFMVFITRFKVTYERAETGPIASAEQSRPPATTPDATHTAPLSGGGGRAGGGRPRRFGGVPSLRERISYYRQD